MKKKLTIHLNNFIDGNMVGHKHFWFFQVLNPLVKDN